ncbi:hypothetical protein C4573_07315 [Candidatus Woesearchaeota archaeon]|nr:MAG: hypothetical protein C4573_07315 [Candidatus Woesearchaeota archaeon]
MPYPYPRIPETIHGKELTILGVEHKPEFFQQYQPMLEDFVKSHDAIVLEQTVGGNFWESGFYGSIGELARKQGKKVYQVDPLGWKPIFLDVVNAGIGLALLYQLITGSKSAETTTRRNFLKKMCQFAVGVPLLAGTLAVRNVQSILALDTTIHYGIDDALGYGLQDYRNIVIAEGLIRLCQEAEDFHTLGSIHGAAHSETVHEYLLSPNKRQKRLAYLPYDMLGNTQIREYTPTSSGWELRRTF